MSEPPLVSYIVVCYKQEQFIRDAIRSAFEQTYEPLEIIFSDDCSPDRTFEIIKEEVDSYRGPHRIILCRNEKNLGIAGNVNHAFQSAHGQFFVMAAGDDISIPDRTALLVDRWQNADPPVDLVCSYHAEIDVDGRPTGFIRNNNVSVVPDTRRNVHSWRCTAIGGGAAYSRRLYDKYGPLNAAVICEDWVYAFRAWLESGIAVIEKPLYYHRTHEGSIAFISRRMKTETDVAVKRLHRIRSAQNMLAVSEEWLKAWRRHGGKEQPQIEAKLLNRVKVCQLQLRARQSSGRQALWFALAVLRHGGGISTAVKLIVRQVFRWQ